VEVLLSPLRCRAPHSCRPILIVILIIVGIHIVILAIIPNFEVPPYFVTCISSSTAPSNHGQSIPNPPYSMLMMMALSVMLTMITTIW
jgi:hypothetical protein